MTKWQILGWCLLSPSSLSDMGQSVNLLVTSFIRCMLRFFFGFPGRSVIKNLPVNAGDAGDSDPWVRKIPWRRKWQPTPVPLSEEFHGQGSLAGYSPWGHKESDSAEQEPSPPSFVSCGIKVVMHLKHLETHGAHIKPH